MRTKFIQFGILAALISNSIFANDLTVQKSVIRDNQFLDSIPSIKNLTKPTLKVEADTIVILVAGYKKTMEEIIKEDNLIIESNISNEVYSLDIDSIEKESFNTIAINVYTKPIEEVIKEDNLIIESSITVEVYPINFKNRINKTSKTKKIVPSYCFSKKCCIKS